MRSRIATVIGTLFLVLGASAVIAFWLNAQEARNTSSANRARKQGSPIPVRTEAVRTRTFEEVISATATTIASEAVPINLVFTPDPGNTGLRLKKVDVFEGKRVTKGDLLFLIEEPRFEMELASAIARVEASKTKLHAAEQGLSVNEVVRRLQIETARETLAYRKQDLKRLQDDFGRLEKLAKEGGFVASIEVTQAFALVAEAQAARTEVDGRLKLLEAQAPLGPLQDEQSVTEARRDLKDAEVELELARRDSKFARIESPLDGFVGTVEVIEGQMLDRRSELTRIYRIDPIFVRANVPIDRIHSVQIGQQARVDVDGMPDKQFAGTVLRIPALADEATKSVPVVVEVANPNYLIKPGVGSFVSIGLTRTGPVVPSVAVLDQGGVSVVFVVRDGSAVVRRVVVGARVDNSLVEVVEGLASGEQVVVYGMADLADGDKVDNDWKRWSGREPQNQGGR